MIFATILGLIVGSLLNIMISRLPQAESSLHLGSRCSHCHHGPRCLDLIPIIGYVESGGLCRHCGARLSLRYPLVESLTGLGFALVVSRWGFSSAAYTGWVLTGLLITAAVTDWETGLVPDRLTYPGMILGLALSVNTLGFKASSLGLIFFFGLLLVTALISDGGIGGGDIKLAGVAGAFLGIEGSGITITLASFASFLLCLPLMLTGRIGRKTPIVFGPFLSISAWLVWNYSQELLRWYLDIFY